MARQTRLDAPGVFHHVHNRGARRQVIFVDDLDRQKFLSLLVRSATRSSAEIHAYCLMGNHYHLLLKSTNGDIDRVMHYQSFQYVKFFNKRHSFDGPLYKDRFASELILDDSYLTTVSRYIHRNPTDISSEPLADYAWSSYGAYLGSRAAPAWLHTDMTLSFFGDSRDHYERFVEEAGPHPSTQLAPQTLPPELLGRRAPEPDLDLIERVVAHITGVATQDLRRSKPGRSNPARLLTCGLADHFGISADAVAEHLAYRSLSSAYSAITRCQARRGTDRQFAEWWRRSVELLDGTAWRRAS